ncbi:hypothetical protein PG997_008727 [Apiospora hydei]|uniref:CENP-V/GFA domain-containing protein n=1 Tax=Apiospora hydei TaxID=1337664 RepID=A0ABR1WBN2_9PEZI
MSSKHMNHYGGNCHCGRYRFEVSLPRGDQICHLVLCTKKAYLWLAPPKGNFRVTRNDSQLTEYDSGVLLEKDAAQTNEDTPIQFCSHCGTGVVGEHGAGPLKGTFLVNPISIQRWLNNYRSAIIAVHTDDDGQQIAGSIDAGPPYTFSCHCGVVKATLNAPLKDQELKEDNCSRCVRTGYIGVYPTKDEVSIPASSWENTFAYGGKYGGGSRHCKTCGVLVFDEVVGPPISVFDSVPLERRERLLEVYHRNMSLQPLNIRCVEGLDLGPLEIQRSDKGTEGYTLDP